VVEALKNMPRTGWVQRGIPPALAEVVASHIYEASIICLEIGYRLAKLGIIGYDDAIRSAVITLVHDIGEGVDRGSQQIYVYRAWQCEGRDRGESCENNRI
jgi:Predicted hydrolases of HD superfamily